MSLEERGMGDERPVAVRCPVSGRQDARRGQEGRLAQLKQKRQGRGAP